MVLTGRVIRVVRAQKGQVILQLLVVSMLNTTGTRERQDSKNSKELFGGNICHFSPSISRRLYSAIFK
jgi:hypothetical protein